MSLPVLWQYNFSSFNEKIRWALDFSLRGTLPVLDLGGERIVDSTRIIEALERSYPEPALYPEGATERARAPQPRCCFRSPGPLSCNTTTRSAESQPLNSLGGHPGVD